MIKSNLAFNEQDVSDLIIRRIRNGIIYILMLLASNSNAQEIHSRITLLKGASVPISFDSYNKMYNGIEYTDWTRFRVLYFDTISTGVLTPGSTWQLLVRANTADIQGDGGIIPMNLDKVELLVTVNNTGTTSAAPASPATYVTLTNVDTPIVINGANSTGIDIGAASGITTEVVISYRLGGNGGPPGINTILGSSSGYYSVDLVFTLQKTP